MNPIRILVGDAEAVMRRGIRQIVDVAGDMLIADEAAGGRELLDRARVIGHDLVLFDLAVSEMDGLDVVKQLRRERPGVPIVILTSQRDDQVAIRALKAGAAGYLTRRTSADELVDAVRKAVAGGRYLTPALAERLAGYLGDDTDGPPHRKLSDREFQVLRMIAAGRSTRQISIELALSVKTVSTYRARIYEKMHMNSAAEIAAYAVRNRLDD